MKQQPLVEVFGYPINNQSTGATRVREGALCPFQNIVPKCTKDSVKHPLGVCSVFEGDTPAITCPVRFREGAQIVDDAAEFFFPKGAVYRSLPEIRLKDGANKSAGNIDHVVVSLDKSGGVLDFGALEVQGVYISGNVRNPFNYYMKSPRTRGDFSWKGQENYPRPDFLSSSRKRLAPQLLYKGGILRAWGKKIAVAVDEAFWATLPKLKETAREKADIAWFVYGLQFNSSKQRYELTKRQAVFTEFEEALLQLTKTEPGRIQDFERTLNRKLKGKMPIQDSVDQAVNEEHDVA